MTIAEKQSEFINKYVVTQHNSLVEANYSNNLSARSLKVARLLVSALSPDTQKLEQVEVEIAALKRFLGYKPNVTWGRFHDDLKDIGKRLNKEPIEIALGKQDTLVAFFISSYRLNIPAGKVTFNISPELAPYLLQLKRSYTSYLLINIPKLRSSYSIRLYELLHQYRKFGKRQFELRDLQNKVGSNYKLYGDFKRKVILQAQRDLKKHTDLAFAFDEKKNGRKVVGIEFIIFGNKPVRDNSSQLSLLENAIEIAEDAEKPALTNNLIKAMNELGISEQNIAKYLAMGFDIVSKKEKREEVTKRCETLETYYFEKLELTKKSADSQNAAGFFIKALQQDWTNSKTLQKSKAETATKERNHAKKKLQNLTLKTEKLSKLKKDQKSPIIDELVANGTVLEAAYNTVVKDMGTFMKKHLSDVLGLPIKEQYEKSVSISSGVGVYLMKYYPDHFKEIVIIDKQIEVLQKEIETIKKKYPSIK